jgi:hypothetical protein
MSETSESSRADAPPSEKQGFSRRIALLVIVLVVGAAMILPHLLSPARHEVRGTLVSVDVAAGKATLEYIDPANGATRDVTGEVPSSCKITIDGKAATLADLKKGDVVVAQADIDRYKGTEKSGHRIVAKEIHVTRAGGSEP